MEKEIDNLIKDSINKGYSPHEIEDTLKKLNYPPEMIKKIIQRNQPQNHKEILLKNTKLIILVSILISILLLSLIFSYTYLKENKINKEIKDGWKLYNQNKFEEAINQFKTLEEYKSKNWEISFGLGLSYYEVKEYLKAKENLQEAIQINPQNPRIFLALGWTYISLKEFEKAEKEFKKVLEITPQSIEPYKGLAMLSYLKREGKEALSYLQKVEEVEELEFDFLLVKASSFMILKNFTEAEKIFNHLKEYKSEKNYCKIWFGLSYIELNRNNKKLAKEYYKKAININPQCPIPKKIKGIFDE